VVVVERGERERVRRRPNRAGGEEGAGGREATSEGGMDTLATVGAGGSSKVPWEGGAELAEVGSTESGC
jgi:hypothetical protein